jgi:hypothetical protein
VETNDWRQNYKTRPNYKQGKAFGDEAARRYGWENAVAKKPAGPFEFDGTAPASSVPGKG